MTTKTLKFAWKKSTTNKEVFEEKPAPGNPPIIGSLYVSNWFTCGAKEISLTIHGDDKTPQNLGQN